MNDHKKSYYKVQMKHIDEHLCQYAWPYKLRGVLIRV